MYSSTLSANALNFSNYPTGTLASIKMYEGANGTATFPNKAVGYYVPATVNGVAANSDGNIVLATNIAGYTVATLPAGTVGQFAYVTDATAPTYLGTLTGGGSVRCPVFHNGTNWVSH